MRKYRNITSPYVKNSLLIAAVFVVAQCVFAVTGKRLSTDSGDDKNKASENTVAFSNLKSSVRFSLKDSYSVNNKNNRNLSFISENAKMQQASFVSFKKGNVTYVLPYKTQAGVKLPTFIKMCPSQSAPR